MSISTSTVCNSLEKAFTKAGFELENNKYYFIVKDSKALDVFKVADIVISAKYLPLVSQVTFNGNYAFSVIPYALPLTFDKPIPEKSEKEVWTAIKNEAAFLSKNKGVSLKNEGTYKSKQDFWAETAKGVFEVSFLVKQFALQHPPGTALDLGCGYGSTTIHLLKKGWTVTAVDYCPEAVKSLKTNAAEWIQNGKLKVVEKNVANLDLVQKYDLVLAERFFPFIHPDVFKPLWGKVANAVKGHLIGTLVKAPGDQESLSFQREVGVWFIRDIGDAAAIIKSMKYKTITLAYHHAIPGHQQIDFLVKK